MLSTVHGKPVVIDGGKAGVLVEVSAQTGKLLWKRPVGIHRGPQQAGLATEHLTPTSPDPLPAKFFLEPGFFGGVESQLASNGSTVFAAVNNFGAPMTENGVSGSAKSITAALDHATGELVAVNQATGKVEWARRLPSSPYGAATATNNVVFTTTYSGWLYGLSTSTGAVVLKTPMSARSNSPVSIDGDYVLAGAGAGVTVSSHDALIIAYRLGATGRLPHTVG